MEGQVRPEWDAALRRADEAGWDRRADASIETVRAVAAGRKTVEVQEIVDALMRISYDDHAPRHDPGS